MHRDVSPCLLQTLHTLKCMCANKCISVLSKLSIRNRINFIIRNKKRVIKKNVNMTMFFSSLLRGPHTNLHDPALPGLWLSPSQSFCPSNTESFSVPETLAQHLGTSCSLYLELLPLILSASQTPIFMFKTPAKTMILAFSFIPNS